MTARTDEPALADGGEGLSDTGDRRPGALVTGAGRGIGRAIAERLSADGFRVAVNDIDADAASSLAAAIGGVAVPGDLSQEVDAIRVADRTVRTLGDLHVLVNNAGIEARSPLREHATDLWDRALAVNLTAPFLLARALADVLARSGRGAIVNVGSIAVTGSAGQVGYDASKGGLVTLSRSLAVELGPEGIRVNCVCPGFIDTQMLRDNRLSRLGEKVTSKLPIGRMGTPSEIAAAVAFLVSNDASYITAQTLFVDGGYVRS